MLRNNIGHSDIVKNATKCGALVVNIQFSGLYAPTKFQVISFNNLKDIYDFSIC